MKLIQKKQHFKEVLKLLTIPLTFLVIYFILFMIWQIFSFPPTDEMVEIVKGFFNEYGLIVIFISSLLEGLLLLGQYFPGGFIIFLGVVSAGKDIPKVSALVAVVSLAFFISYFLNYLLGRYGWHKLFMKFGLEKSLEKAGRRVQKHVGLAILLGFFEPDLATITATSAGILQVPIKRFLVYSAIGIIVWNAFWGTLVYSLGASAMKLVSIEYIFMIIIMWIILVLVKYGISKIREHIKYNRLSK